MKDSYQMNFHIKIIVSLLDLYFARFNIIELLPILISTHGIDIILGIIVFVVITFQQLVSKHWLDSQYG